MELELHPSIIPMKAKRYLKNALKPYMTVFMDDYDNIHSPHSPSSPWQTQVCHMEALFVKKFATLPAVRPHNAANKDIRPDIFTSDALIDLF